MVGIPIYRNLNFVLGVGEALNEMQKKWAGGKIPLIQFCAQGVRPLVGIKVLWKI
jgi:hypothetical protein